MKRLCALGMGLLLCFSSFAQQDISAEVLITDALKGKNEVPFSGPQLTWDDFNGKADNSLEWTAMTYSGIKIRYERRIHNHQHFIKVELYPYMDKSRSWYTKAGYNSYTLAHEQRHFDITILVTRQLAEALSEIEYSPEKFVKQINEVHDRYLQKLKNMQAQYDEETMHGVNMNAQRTWDRKIAQDLMQFAVNE